MNRWRDVGQDRRGIGAVEFAILAPVMFLLIFGLGDLLYQVYLRAMLQGAVVKAGRDNALEGNAIDQGEIDNKVRSTLKQLGNDIEVSMQRRSYSTFALVKPEVFDDKNTNGTRDTGECFDDTNGNGTWDADPGLQSQGGANDVTRYSVTIVYKRVFPVADVFGGGATQTMTASTLMKNQPYKAQVANVVKSICT